MAWAPVWVESRVPQAAWWCQCTCPPRLPPCLGTPAPASVTFVWISQNMNRAYRVDEICFPTDGVEGVPSCV